MPAVKPVVDTSQLREAQKLVKEIDPKIRTQLIRDLKGDLKPFANQLVSMIPTKAPLSGMANHDGRTRWEAPTSSVHITPGGGRGSLARIEVFSKQPFGAGFKLADLAGTRNRGTRVRREYTRSINGRRVAVRSHGTTSGDVLIQRLQSRYKLSAAGKGGRFVWGNAMKMRPALVEMVIQRLDEYAQRIERGSL